MSDVSATLRQKLLHHLYGTVIIHIRLLKVNVQALITTVNVDASVARVPSGSSGLNGLNVRPARVTSPEQGNDTVCRTPTKNPPAVKVSANPFDRTNDISTYHTYFLC